MTDTEMRSWLHCLAKDNQSRAAIIKDMLRHANGDRMSEQDRVICRRALVLIDSRLSPPSPDFRVDNPGPAGIRSGRREYPDMDVEATSW